MLRESEQINFKDELSLISLELTGFHVFGILLLRKHKNPKTIVNSLNNLLINNEIVLTV